MTTIPFVIDNQQRLSVCCTTMRGVSPLTTIHEPPKLPRSIVGASLAGAMPPCGDPVWETGNHASRPRLQKFDAHPPQHET